MTGAELKTLRKRINVSADKAARQVRISRRTWLRHEASEHVPEGIVELFKLKNDLATVEELSHDD